jgi:hypothetical protein
MERLIRQRLVLEPQDLASIELAPSRHPVALGQIVGREAVWAEVVGSGGHIQAPANPALHLVEIYQINDRLDSIAQPVSLYRSVRAG